MLEAHKKDSIGLGERREGLKVITNNKDNTERTHTHIRRATNRNPTEQWTGQQKERALTEHRGT